MGVRAVRILAKCSDREILTASMQSTAFPEFPFGFPGAAFNLNAVRTIA